MEFQFFDKNTQTFYEPYLVTTFDDLISDDRNTFYKIKFPTKRRVVDFMPIGLAHTSTNRGCLAVFEDGTMMTWGINNNGALGNQVSPNSLPLEYPSWVIGFEPFNK